MKKLSALALAVLIIFTACSKPEKSLQSGAQTETGSAQTENLSTDDQTESLTQTAKILTEAICSTTAGFTFEKDIAQNSLIFPNERSKTDLTQFVATVAHYQMLETGSEAIYKDHFYKSPVSGKTVTEEGIDLLLSEVFGIENHEISQSEVLEYVSMPDFDSVTYNYVEKNKGCLCGKIQSTEIDLENRRVYVEFTADFLNAEDFGKAEVPGYWRCRTTFTIGERADKTLYLTFENTEVLEMGETVYYSENPYYIPFPVGDLENSAHTDDFTLGEKTEHQITLPIGMTEELCHISVSVPKSAELRDNKGEDDIYLTDGVRLPLFTDLRIYEMCEQEELLGELEEYRDPENAYGYISHARVICGVYDCLVIKTEAYYDYWYEYYIPLNEREVFHIRFAVNKGSDPYFALQEKIIANISFNVKTNEQMPEQDGKPCKYNEIPGYEFETENIASYKIIQGGTGYTVIFTDAARTDKIRSLLESLKIYNTQEEKGDYNAHRMGTMYYLKGLNREGNEIFELGFCPFSVIVNYGSYYTDYIPYKTDNGEEISRMITEMFLEKHTEDWNAAAGN